MFDMKMVVSGVVASVLGALILEWIKGQKSNET